MRGAAGAVLTIDLDAIAENWRRLAARARPAEASAVVKADAYGLGLAPVARALWNAGCRRFFVAYLDEGIALRRVLADAWIAIFLGVDDDDRDDLVAHRLVPVLNHLGQLEAWSGGARGRGAHAEAVLHLDTGMTRLGMPRGEVDRLLAEPDRLGGVRLSVIMSHLACADEPAHPKNVAQRDAFRAARGRLDALLGPTPGSLANSSGIFLGPEFHGELVRPGVALYGVNPTPTAPNPMRDVVRLQGKIVQVQHVDRSQTVGYGATHTVERPARIATVSAGYADGYLRSASNRASVVIAETRVPLVGRVSMDMITLDVTDVPTDAARPGTMVDLLGGSYSVDHLATDCGTIGYEILTSLGARYRRRYVGQDAGTGS